MTAAFRDQIAVALGTTPSDYHENTKARSVSFEVDMDLNFDVLSRLSKVLGTTKINISATTERYGGCDTCGYGSSGGATPIYAWDVKFPETEE